jgi:folate-binding protein YgfZ
MDEGNKITYDQIRGGRAGFYEQPRALIAVLGREAIPFLDGMITNDMKTLADGGQMLAAFPNPQGRLLAVVRVQRQGDRYLFDTEAATREKLFQSLFRFTFAGDFFVEDLSDAHSYFEIFGPKEDVYNPNVGERWQGAYVYELPYGASYFVPKDLAHEFHSFLAEENACIAIPDQLYETLRIEAGIPKYGVDMDETTVVPELGLDGLISYNKGCYIGQEIIARIHFRGHVAKQLTGVALASQTAGVGQELVSNDGKPAGRITSFASSPKLERMIALAFVRYEHLAAGTELSVDGIPAVVTPLPFVKQ